MNPPLIVRRFRCLAGALLIAWASLLPSPAETGYDAWLRYERLEKGAARNYRDALPAAVVLLDQTEVGHTAREELVRGLRGMLGSTLRETNALPGEPAILLGTLAGIKRVAPQLGVVPTLTPDGFWLKTTAIGGRPCLVVAGATDRGLLYGVFALLRRINLNQTIHQLDLVEKPSAPIRFLNHWDNLDGSIERGYAGKSIFWDQGHVTTDLGRVRDYARLLASVGINGCSINNVNADSRVITPEFLPQVARLAEAFRPWGVKLLISLDFASPRKLGGIDTFDPLDPRAVAFWEKTVAEIYRIIPDLAGFVVKADSEGRLGPSQYGRTHADAANVIARAARPFGGVVCYRGFVYNHKMDWNDLHLDRATAAYDNFHPLDGKFETNVVIQVKHGPIDFQVREPVSPLLGDLPQTRQVIELQITQEYLGQQRHLCYLVPLWKTALDFDFQLGGPGTPVKALLAGRAAHHPAGGYVGVSNVGRDTNWLGHHLALANLYGFGRLAWNPDLGSRALAEEWTRQTFGPDPRMVKTIVDMEMDSWPAYENYSGPLGIGTLTDIIGVHFGPGVESSEHNGWGQWHRSDEHGLGMNRTVANGTGFIGQYPHAVAQWFESLDTCPDELLLFLHHVPYTHVLHSGKTVIQHFYDSHYTGAARAARLVSDWESLRGKIDEPRFNEVRERLQFQAGHAIAWRDAVCDWFAQKSGIADAAGRVGHHPDRFEAEVMQMEGYAPLKIIPWETASGGQAAQLVSTNRQGALHFGYPGKSGWYDLDVRYFDQNNGVSHFRLRVAGQLLDEWDAAANLPSRLPDGHTSTRRILAGVALRPGDEIRLEATSPGGETAVVDYVEITPAM